MGEWPEGWFRDEGPAPSVPGAAEPTASIRAGSSGSSYADDPTAAGQYQVRNYSSSSGGSASAPPGAWPDQPPPKSLPGWRFRPPSSGRRWTRPRRILGILAILIALILVGTVGTYFYLNSKLHRANILVDYSGRPALASGTNWLIAGSDSRQGLTRAQERQYGTGHDISGHRSDTILILHVPAGGGHPLLISLPRDSYVHIPGSGMNKLNAAFAFGGPKLLAETVQDATGLHISHYMGIGFGGFVNVVDDVGGVRLCVKHALNDRASNLHLKAGCQVLTGGQALAYVRDRHTFSTQDLQREQDQRIFLKALLTKMTSPGVMFNPFSALPAASGAVDTLTVDNSTSLYQLIRVAMALRGAQTTTVPIANSNYVTAAGDAVLWNSQEAKTLFNDLNAGRPVPKSLITGSKQGT